MILMSVAQVLAHFSQLVMILLAPANLKGAINLLN